MTKLEDAKPVVIQRLQEGFNLAQIADELRVSPHAVAAYMSRLKDEGLIEGDGRTSEGLIVDGKAITFYPDKQCRFPGCEWHRKRGTMGIQGAYCERHTRAYGRRRHELERLASDSGRGTIHYGYDQFEAEVENGIISINELLKQAGQPVVKMNVAPVIESSSFAGGLPPLEPERPKNDIPDLSEKALKLLVSFSHQPSVNMHNFGSDIHVVNTLLSRRFIEVIGREQAKITDLGKSYLKHWGLLEPLPNKTLRESVLQDQIKELVDLTERYEHSQHNHDVRIQEVLEGIVEKLHERETVNHNGKPSEDVMVIDGAEAGAVDREIDPTLEAFTMEFHGFGIDVDIRIVPLSLRDLGYKETEEYFQLMGRQVSIMLQAYYGSEDSP